MRIAAIALLLLTVAGGAFAWDSANVTAPGPVNLPEVREAFYCQQPSTSWNANNASVAFSSEMADGIPATYAGMNVTEVTLYVAEWGGGWTNPQGMIVNFYNASCPRVSVQMPTTRFLGLNAPPRLSTTAAGSSTRC